MEETIVKETVAPDAASAEIDNGGKSENAFLGKFKDVNALLNAYNSLQSEFTKRCQRLKELEGAALSGKESSPDGYAAGTAENTKQDVAEKNNTEEINGILKEYLKGVLGKKQTAVLMSDGGVSVKTPVAKPKTFAEAGALAKEILQ